MDPLTLVPLAAVVVTAGLLGFILWKPFRRVRRYHLYVPVTAKVTNVCYNRFAALSRDPTLSVEYEFAEKTISARFATSDIVAWEAEATNQIQLLIDPEYPQDVVEAPSFISEAEAHSRLRFAELVSRKRIVLLASLVALIAFPVFTAFLGSWIPRGTPGHIVTFFGIGWIIIFLSTMFLGTRYLLRLRDRSFEVPGGLATPVADRDHLFCHGERQTIPGVISQKGRSCRKSQ